MRQYSVFFKMRVINGLQYRTAAYAGMATQFFWGAMEILLYSAFDRSNAAAFPMTMSQLSSYIWLKQAFLALFMTWGLDQEIFALITSGNVAYELVRPLDLYCMWFVRNLASRVAKVIVRCGPLLLVAVLLPEPYGLAAPGSLLQFGLFLLSMILGIFVTIAVCMLIYIPAFWTISAAGVNSIAMTVIEFLSGGIIPLPFMPEQVEWILNLLPFASMQNTPFLIYSGHVAEAKALAAVALQLVWLAILVGIGWYIMRRALRRVVVQGG